MSESEGSSTKKRKISETFETVDLKSLIENMMQNLENFKEEVRREIKEIPDKVITRLVSEGWIKPTSDKGKGVVQETEILENLEGVVNETSNDVLLRSINFSDEEIRYLNEVLDGNLNQDSDWLNILKKSETANQPEDQNVDWQKILKELREENQDVNFDWDWRSLLAEEKEDDLS